MVNYKWLRQSQHLYINVASRCPIVEHAVRIETRRNVGFSRLLDQSFQHLLSRKLPWESYLKSPLTRLQRYCLLLKAILEMSDKVDAKHEYVKLNRLIQGLRVVASCYEALLVQGSNEVQIKELRSRIGDSGNHILPDNIEI